MSSKAKLSSRQWQLQLRELAKDQYAKLLDYFTCVERMSQWSSQQLIKSMKRVSTQWFITIKGPNNHDDMKIDVEELVVGLPLHLLGCLITQQPNDGQTHLSDCHLSVVDNIDYLQKAFQLLYNLLSLTLRNARLLSKVSNKTINPKFVESVINLSLMSLLTVAGPMYDNCIHSVSNPIYYNSRGGKNSNCSGFAAMVSYSIGMLLKATKIEMGEAVEEEEEEIGLVVNDAIVDILIRHPQARLMTRILFDGVGVIVSMIREGIRCRAKTEDVRTLCYCAGASMEIITQLIDHASFYYYMIMADPSAQAPLRLLLAGFQLIQPPLYIMHVHDVQYHILQHPQGDCEEEDMVASQVYGGDIEFLGARCFLLLNSLLPTHYTRKISFFSSVQEDEHSLSMLKQISDSANLLAGNILLRPPITKTTQMGFGERQLFIHALRCSQTMVKLNVEDSFAHMLNIINDLLDWDHHDFCSRWAGGKESVLMHFVYDFAIVSSQPEVDLLWQGILETCPMVIDVPHLPKLKDPDGNEVDEQEILQNALGYALEMAIHINNLVNIMIRQVEVRENTQQNWSALENLLKKIPPSDKLSVCSPMDQ